MASTLKFGRKRAEINVCLWRNSVMQLLM